MSETILFDLYGTLIYEAGGIRGLYEELSRFLGVTVAAFQEARKLSYKPEYKTQQERNRVVLRLLNLPDSSEKAATLTELEQKVRVGNIRTYPDTIPTLIELKEAGHKLGIISNCTPIWKELLKEQEITKLFDVTVLSCDAGIMKPAPEIYKLACQKLNTKPEHCWFVGDGGDRELEGATALNMKVVYLDQQGSWTPMKDDAPEPTGYDYKIERLAEFPALLR